MPRLFTLGELALRLDGAGGAHAPPQTKRLVLLAYLRVAAPGQLVRRDTLLALFWPDLGDAAAHNALRQALHYLRRRVGREAFVGQGEAAVGVAAEALWCDAAAVGDAAAGARWPEAAAAYGGEFLAGVHVADAAPELEEWIARTRERLRGAAVEASSRAADEASAAGDLVEAVRLAGRAEELAPDRDDVARRLVAALSRAGRGGDATQAYGAFAARLARDYGAAPAPETRALLASLRLADGGPGAVGAAAVEPAATPGPTAFAGRAPVDGPRDDAAPGMPAGTTLPAVRARRGRRPALAAAAGVGLLLAGQWAARPPPVLAPGPSGLGRGQEVFRAAVAAHDAGQAAAALPLLRRAAALDSTNALAVYQAGRALYDVDTEAGLDLVERALRLAERAPARDRALVRVGALWVTNAPAFLAVADSAAARYPDDANFQLALGGGLLVDGQARAARAVARRVLAHVATRGALPRPAAANASELAPYATGTACPACSAWLLLVSAAIFDDSLATAEEAGRSAVAAHPGDARLWAALRRALVARGRYAAAAAAHGPGELAAVTGATTAIESDVLERAEFALMAGDFAAARVALAGARTDGNADLRREALWWEVIRLRTEGRLGAALATARAYRRAAAQAPAPETRAMAAVLEAIVLGEQGHHAAAAALFDSLAASTTPLQRRVPAWRYRHRVWMSVHAAQARAAAGDTAGLAALADSMQRWGLLSAYRRDRRLHLHVRGLLARARGNATASEAYFRAATFSPTVGYTRTSVELARTLLDAGRPGEAVAVLRPTLHAGLEGPNLYVTHAEVHALLARAFAAHGVHDSAIVHARWVARAWRAGDPAFAAAAPRLLAAVASPR